MMASPAPKNAIVMEVRVKSEQSLGLEGVCIKSEPLLGYDDGPSLGDDYEPSYSDTCVKDEPSSPEVADARAVSEAVAVARLYAGHVVKDEVVSTSTSVQPRRLLCEAPGQKLMANVKQEKADTDKIAVTPTSVKQEPKWEAEKRNMVQLNWKTDMMAASHREPKIESEGNMPAPIGGPTVFIFCEEVKLELLKREADDCKLNEPQSRIPAPNPLNQNGPMMFKRVWLPDSDFDDAVIGSTPTESPVKRVVVCSSRVKCPVKRILGSSAPATATSQPAQLLVTAIRESRCRNMLEMFPEISPSCIKNTLVKHGWDEKRSRDELRSMTRKRKTRLRHRPRTKAHVLTSLDTDPDLQCGRKQATGGAGAAAARTTTT